ncbi:hypothetical protein B0T16DRAFT_395227 [Cercophora newfieldiana]|uniref:Uncharacterized protein n=1 Tax=Cercophora newfieldiana TaxID=92897 RepID=A0AA39XSN8_9PEZI|nr:hypothetical protein B0T16DRAFT_395227 [Cercophora newfieldiana]
MGKLLTREMTAGEKLQSVMTHPEPQKALNAPTGVDLCVLEQDIDEGSLQELTGNLDVGFVVVSHLVLLADAVIFPFRQIWVRKAPFQGLGERAADGGYDGRNNSRHSPRRTPPCRLRLRPTPFYEQAAEPRGGSEDSVYGGFWRDLNGRVADPAVKSREEERMANINFGGREVKKSKNANRPPGEASHFPVGHPHEHEGLW